MIHSAIMESFKGSGNRKYENKVQNSAVFQYLVSWNAHPLMKSTPFTVFPTRIAQLLDEKVIATKEND